MVRSSNCRLIRGSPSCGSEPDETLALGSRRIPDDDVEYGRPVFRVGCFDDYGTRTAPGCPTPFRARSSTDEGRVDEALMATNGAIIARVHALHVAYRLALARLESYRPRPSVGAARGAGLAL